MLLDLGSHALDLAVWLAGWPVKALCRTHRLYDARPTPDGGVARDLTEDYVTALMVLENGAVGTLEASKIATGAEAARSYLAGLNTTDHASSACRHQPAVGGGVALHGLDAGEAPAAAVGGPRAGCCRSSQGSWGPWSSI